MASKVQDCDCGFIDSGDPTESIFTSFLAINFGSISNKEFDKIFIPASYEISKSGSSYIRDFSPDQVELTEDGLDITVLPSSDSENVPCGQVFTRDATFFYGSYHAKVQVGDVAGTTTAFFNYNNDSSEVDIEYLSAWDEPTLLYTTKPQIYLDSGNPSNLTYQRQQWNDTSASFNEDFHDWAFVWLPDIVHFGLDANYSSYITTNVAQAPGRLALSQWSDGNANYSLGPPTKESTITVAFLWAVYNNTEASELTCEKAISPCTITDGVFQPSSSSGDGDGNGDGDGSGSPPVIDINSAGHHVDPLAPSWLLGLFCLFWLSYWRSS